MSGRRAWWLFGAALLLAAALRFPELYERPMHTDEAVHAVKLGSLLEAGDYRYDPFEYHGPTLNYLTLPLALLRGQQRYADLDEFTLRGTTALFGLLAVLLLLTFRSLIGAPAAGAAALFTAVSPAMVYYSRYYIMEILLTAFLLAALGFGLRYLQTGRRRDALLAGAALGLMQATKETAPLFMLAMLLAALPVFRGRWQIRLTDLLLAALMALGVAALLYSSFGTHPEGMVDALRTYLIYLQRAGVHDHHLHPWWFYWERLLWFRLSPGPLWSEGLVLMLAIAGIAAAFSRRHRRTEAGYNMRFLVWFTLISSLLFSLLPYKTPWNLLGFWQGWLLLAGTGAAALYRRLPESAWKWGLLVLTCLLGLHLLLQSWRAGFVYPADPVNPWVYAHTHTDLPEVARQAERLALAQPEGYGMPIEVVFPGGDYWPLPWYLRRFTKVGWWEALPEGRPPAPLLLIAPEVEGKLIGRLYERPPPGERHLYVPLMERLHYLRPAVEVRGYVRKACWDRWQRAGVDAR